MKKKGFSPCVTVTEVTYESNYKNLRKGWKPERLGEKLTIDVKPSSVVIKCSGDDYVLTEFSKRNLFISFNIYYSSFRVKAIPRIWISSNVRWFDFQKPVTEDENCDWDLYVYTGKGVYQRAPIP